MKLSEEQLQIQVAEFLDLALVNAVWWHTPNGGKRSKAVAGKMKAAGQKAGIPDILILHEGSLHAIELKVPGNYLSSAQKAMKDRLEVHGLTNFEICRSLDEVQATLMAFGIPARRIT